MKGKTILKSFGSLALILLFSTTLKAYDISGTVYFDANNDGTFNGNDVEIPVMTVEVYADANSDGVPDNGTPLDSDASDASGDYSFTGITGNVVVTVKSSSLGDAAEVRETVQISSATTTADIFIVGQYPVCYAFADLGDDFVTFNRFDGVSLILNGSVSPNIEGATTNYDATQMYAMDADNFEVYNYTTGARISRGPDLGTFQYKNNSGGTSSVDIADVDGIAIAGSDGVWLGEVAAGGIVFRANTSGVIVDNYFGSGWEGVEVVLPAAISSCGQLDDLAVNPADGKLYGAYSGCAGTTSYIVEIPTTGGGAGVVTTYWPIKEGATDWDDVEGLTLSLYGQLMGTTGANATPSSQNQHHLSFEIFNGTVVSSVAIAGSSGDYESCDCIARNSDPFVRLSISGTVYNDADKLTDGQVDGTPISDVGGSTLYAFLTDAAGIVIERTTLSSGTYTFDDALTNFAYQVVISTTDAGVGTAAPTSGNLPSGFNESGEAFGANNEAGSGNESGTPNLSIPVTTGTTNITGVNFGISEVNTISGTVWLDENNNESIEGGETVRGEGVKVYLYSDSNNDGNIDGGSSPIDSVITGADGTYEFNRDYTGGTISYITAINEETLPTGQELTTDNKETASFTGRGEDTDNDFGYNLSSDFVRITGTVWRDSDEDQTIDGGETERAQDILLKVYTDDNSNGNIDGDESFVFVTATTDANGEYLVDLPYSGAVQFIVEVAESSLPGNLTTSDISLATFGAGAGGTTITDRDFGYNADPDKKYISGTVFNDSNQDTTFNTGDLGDEGVTVSLYADVDGDGVYDAGTDTLVTTTTTNSKGFYEFELDDECETFTQNIRVDRSSDDGSENTGNGNMDITKNEIEMGKKGDRIDAVIFRGLNINQGAEILNSYIQFTADKNGEVDGTVTITGFLQTNTATLTTGNSNISNRTPTAETQSWTINKDDWDNGQATTNERTPSLTTIVQEIVNQTGWLSGNRMGFKFTSPDSENEAQTYDRSSAAAPLFYVQYKQNCNENFIIKIDESDLPTGYQLTTDDVEVALNLTPGTIDVGNDFGYKFPGSIAGNVFNDNDGLNNSTVDGSGLNTPDGALLYANLVDASGDVLFSTPVNADGTYNFINVPPGTFSVDVSTNQGTAGLTAPAKELPENWVSTGENLGAGSGNDGTVNGSLTSIVVGSTAVTQANLAINKRPESAISFLEDVVDKGGFDSHEVTGSLFKTSTNTTGNDDTEDFNGGTVEDIKITSFPTNTNVFTVNGTKYTNGGTCPPAQSCTAWPGTLTIPTTNGTPDWDIEVDPIDNDATSSIPFVSVDDAGLEDLSAGKVDITFLHNSTVATDDDNSTFVNTAVGGNVKTNDFDPEGNTQTFGSFLNQDGSGSTISTGATVSGVDTAGNAVVNAGTLVFQGSGKYTYTPATDFIGEIAVPYSICDNGNPQACDTALLVIEVEPEEDPTDPDFNNVFANDDDAYSYGSAISANALNNDGDPEADSFYLTSFKYDVNGDGTPTASGTLGAVTTVAGKDNLGNEVTDAGDFEIDKYGDYTFTPTAGFEGNVTIEYEICDTVSGANQACEVANINIIVYADNGAANDPPFAGDDFAYTSKNVSVVANWINNDYDVNADEFNINGDNSDLDKTSLAADTSAGAISVVATDSGGQVRFYANGQYRYIPPTDYIGPDQVKYEICDETAVAPQPLCDSATMYFVVSGIVRDYGDLPLKYSPAWNVFKDNNNDGIPEGKTPIWLGEFVTDDDSTLYNPTASGDADDGLMMPTELDSNLNNEFKVIVNSTKSNITVHFKLYFDWDKDGEFEAIYSGSGLTGSPDTVTVDVAYPGGDGTFNARLRVALDPDDIDSTGQMMNGETEDYIGALTPVPVELLYFTARAEGNTSFLEWETASELNNSHFDIERRSPKTEWEKIGETPGNGTTQEVQYYPYTDYSPLRGLNLYRLRQVDFDGAYAYSNVEAVNFDLEGDIAVYPNPARDRVTVVFSEMKTTTTVSLLNPLGQPLERLTKDAKRGSEQVSFDLSQYASGVYFIKVDTQTNSKMIKIIVD